MTMRMMRLSFTTVSELESNYFQYTPVLQAGANRISVQNWRALRRLPGRDDW
jgi:hypothetical protein